MKKHALITSAAEKEQKKVKISIFDYDESNFTEHEISLNECLAFKDKPTVTWINIDGTHDQAAINHICECYGLNKFIQEQVADNSLRPKIEDHGDHLFVIMKMFLYNKETSTIVPEQVSMVIGKHYVITFQERNLEEDVFDPIRKRIRSAGTKIRQSNTDYLVYRLMDSVIDYYFAIMEIMGERVEEIELETVTKPDKKTLLHMQQIRKDMLYLRRYIWPMREILNSMQRGETKLISVDVQRSLRTLYEHLAQVIDTIEILRETMSSLLDIYLSSISNKLNEVMKVLTVISTIFMPLTFLVGVYGMNFRHMPELEWRYGYLMVWGVIALIVIGMLIYFRKKKWL
jgi:magnesium transporter